MNNNENNNTNDRLDRIENMMEKITSSMMVASDSNEVIKAEQRRDRAIIGDILVRLDANESFKNTTDSRLTTLELNEEITTEQCKTINSRCNYRVCEILNYNDVKVRQIYYRVYISDLYKFLRKGYGLGSAMAKTRKGNYDNIFRGIEAWYPNNSVLKQRAEENYKFRNNIDGDFNFSSVLN